MSHPFSPAVALVLCSSLLGGSLCGEPLTVPAGGKTGFTLLKPAETGIDFTNAIEEIDGAKNRTLYNGSGVAVGDYNADGKPDLFFCSLQGHSRLYKNLGNWKFEDVTAAAGVECLGYICRGAVFADVNADGADDLLVGTNDEGVLAFFNDGKGRFVNRTKEAGTGSRNATVTLAVADVDGDGDLDYYACNNRNEDIRDIGFKQFLRVDGKLTVPAHLRDRFVLGPNEEIQEYGQPDALYLNDGKGQFAAASWTDGTFLDADGKALTEPPLDWGLTAQFRDMNGDGSPDLYVCNDYWTPDRVYLNDGKGRFKEIANLALRNLSASSMGVDFADIDRDGDYDCFVVDMLSRDHQRRKMQMGAMKASPIALGLIDNRPQVMRNTLHLNRGDGTYAEAAYMAGVAASEWSWQPVFLDVDLDGLEDILVTAGHYRDVQDADTSNKIKSLQAEKKLVPEGALGLTTIAPDRQAQFTAELLHMSRMRPRLNSPVVAFRNKGGAAFEDVTATWGTESLAVHHGIAYADFDGDGDLDLAVNNLGDPAGIYRNNASAGRVTVRLKGPAGNPAGVGAQVRLIGGAVPLQSQEVVAGGRYLSGSDAALMFATGKVKSGMSLEVVWRDGRRSTVRDVKANLRYVVDATSATAPEPKPDAAPPAPLFADMSSVLGHAHHENGFDDFKRQLLLPNRLSQLGPGVAWGDLNGDGADDLLIGAGQGGTLSAFAGGTGGALAPLALSGLETPLARDATGLLIWSPGAGKSAMLAGMANFEDGENSGSAALEFAVDAGTVQGTGAIPQNGGSTGPMAMADLNGDGLLDLFVGGRSVPGRYPEAADSRLFLRRGAKWVADEANNSQLKALGLVSGAVFSDLNGDGAADLVIAREWGPVTVFLNDGKGSLRNATEKMGLAKLSGWWNGVTTGDLNGDGRMDIVATNWGRNSKYEHHYDAKNPLLVYWGEFNKDGIVQVVESHFDHGMHKLVPERGLSCSSLAMPFIRKLQPTYQAFGGSGLVDIYGDHLKKAPQMSASVLDHTLFLNRGDRFEAVPLPHEAQLAPGFGVNVADFDGDGNEDVFMTQNFFSAQVETPRSDAGRSLILRGNGKGGLVPMAAMDSGVAVYGDARGSAVGDWDGDGRADLVVGQNSAATRLFHNKGAKPGLRVRLAGLEGNATGIGAQVALVSKAGKRGAVREVQAGSGYWSQNSPVAVLSGVEAPAKVWVRWPGGAVSTVDVPAEAREVVVEAAGVPTAALR